MQGHHVVIATHMTVTDKDLRNRGAFSDFDHALTGGGILIDAMSRGGGFGGGFGGSGGSRSGGGLRLPGPGSFGGGATRGRRGGGRF